MNGIEMLTLGIFLLLSGVLTIALVLLSEIADQLSRIAILLECDARRKDKEPTE